jgi:hypothetical protein
VSTQKGDKKPIKTALTRLKRRLSVQDMAAVDGRTRPVRAVARWKRELVEALGGDAEVTPQKMALVDAVARTMLLLNHTDAYLMELASKGGALVNKRDRCLFPIVLQREQLVASLSRTLAQIGLERTEKEIGLPLSWVHKVEPYAIEPDPEQPSPAEESGGENADH